MASKMALRKKTGAFLAVYFAFLLVSIFGLTLQCGIWVVAGSAVWFTVVSGLLISRNDNCGKKRH